MNRPQVQIESENKISTLRRHLEKMLPEFEALPGVIGLTLNGGLSRGYADHLSIRYSYQGSTGKGRVCLPFPVRGEIGGGVAIVNLQPCKRRVLVPAVHVQCGRSRRIRG